MNLFRFIISPYKGEQFVVATSLNENQITKVVAPMVQDITSAYNLEDYVDALREAYPRAIIMAEWEADIITF